MGPKRFSLRTFVRYVQLYIYIRYVCVFVLRNVITKYVAKHLAQSALAWGTLKEVNRSRTERRKRLRHLYRNAEQGLQSGTYIYGTYVY